MTGRLALFDLDGTLLDGDTDELWCDFLVDEGVLDGATFTARNRDVADRYAEGRITPEEFCAFYAATLAGRSADEWAAQRARFVAERIVPRLKPGGRAALARHARVGDRVVLTTATNRYLVEPIAAELGVADLIATELENDAAGRFSGRNRGILNMRDGKVVRIAAWLQEHDLAGQALDRAAFYSDSVNDLPLLQAVGEAVVVDADERLAAFAKGAGWRAVSFFDGPGASP